MQTTLVTLTIFFQTLCLLALTTLTHLLVLHPQTKSVNLSHFLTLHLHLLLESMTHRMSVPSKRLNNSLLVLILIAYIIAAIVTITALTAEHLLLKALAVQLKATRTLTVTTYLFLFLHLLLLVINMRDYYYIAGTF